MKKTGVLSADGIKYTNNYIKWQGWTPFSENECNNCDILPLCMGGCPYKSIYKDKDSKLENISCVSWRFNLVSMLTMMKRAKGMNLLAVKGRDKKACDAKPKEKSVA